MSEFSILEGDCLARLSDLPDRSVQTCVTSPPYWGLRDYGNEGQLGLEPTPEQYVANLVAVFREVRRVLRDDGTLWLNLGDSYAGYWGDKTAKAKGERSSADTNGWTNGFNMNAKPNFHDAFDGAGIKPKDLVGIPWMVAFALRADGWYLRSDIIWAKPNPMPESVTDRPTKAHEYLFLLTKKPSYYYDADAVREADQGTDHNHRNVLDGQAGLEPSGGLAVQHSGLRTVNGRNGTGRNKRSVWTVTTQPFPGAHFATFPPKLIEPCVLAGSPPKCCGECGAPYGRVTETRGLEDMAQSTRPQQRRAAEIALEKGLTDAHLAAARATGPADVGRAAVTQNGVNADATKALALEAKEALAGYFREFTAPAMATTGWRPTCGCGGLEPGDLELIESPLAERVGEDPSRRTGRAGMNRPRHPDEGTRPITRYEQRRYAEQLRSLPDDLRSRLGAEVGASTFAHYIRTDRSGARPIPAATLDAWIEAGHLRREHPPEGPTTPTRPATVLDPFNGAGTTGLVALRHDRDYIGIELNPKYAQMARNRILDDAPLLNTCVDSPPTTGAQVFTGSPAKPRGERE